VVVYLELVSFALYAMSAAAVEVCMELILCHMFHTNLNIPEDSLNGQNM
jgi:hypothetical protein